MLEGPNKWLKQINQIKLNRVKNLKTAGGKPAGYLQARSRIWTRDYREQIQLTVRTGLGPPNYTNSALQPLAHAATL